MQGPKTLSRTLGITLLAILFGAGSAYAQTTTGSDASGSSGTAGKSASSKTLSKADQEIMRKMAQANIAEIEGGKLALSQSKNDHVKTFAQKMIDDHTQSQKELEQLAQARGMTLPGEPNSKHKEALKKLGALEGEKFDKRYMSQGGIHDHQEEHRMLSRAQSHATDPDLKALVAKTEPVVNEHMKMARDMQSGKGTASGSSMGPAGTSSSGASESPSTGK